MKYKLLCFENIQEAVALEEAMDPFLVLLSLLLLLLKRILAIMWAVRFLVRNWERLVFATPG